MAGGKKQKVRSAQRMAKIMATVMVKDFRDGTTPVFVDYRCPGACVSLRLGDDWRVRVADELIVRLAELAGDDGVEVEYN